MNARETEFVAQRAKKIERALAAKRWTQVHLASKTGYDARTIHNVLKRKPVREQTILDICQALGIEAELDNGQQVDFADPGYGEYPRGPYRKYEGGYFAYRRSFSSPTRLMRTVIELDWCEGEGLLFHEYSKFSASGKRINNSQTGTSTSAK
jgi:DNA-binding Xre family transcriptional regulator